MKQLLSEIDSHELSEWMAYNLIEPFGEDRADMRAGIVASTFANAHRGKDTNPFTPMDFMLFREREEEKPKDANALSEAIKAAFSKDKQ